MTRLKPSFPRVFLRVGAAIFVFSAIGYFWQGLHDGEWWSLGYIASLAIPVVLVPVLVWFMFVPRLFEYSDYQINLQTLMRSGSYRWGMLDGYGPGNNVFMIQFDGDSGAYQILSSAYPREQWSAFTQFLDTRFSDRKKTFSAGDRLIR